MIQSNAQVSIDTPSPNDSEKPLIAKIDNANAAPDRRRDEAIRTVDVKQTRRAAKRNLAHKKPHRLQPACAQQRDELISSDQKRNEVNASERALKAQPAQPEFGREMHSRTPIANLSAPSEERTPASNGAHGVTRPTHNTHW